MYEGVYPRLFPLYKNWLPAEQSGLELGVTALVEEASSPPSSPQTRLPGARCEKHLK